MQGPAIHFHQVSLELSNTLILDRVSFAVAPGSIHCLIGVNGGGKTSLVRSLLGQMPHHGDIRIDWLGEARIGYVPQQLDFDKTLPLSVKDFMTMVCQRRPVFLGTKSTSKLFIEQALARVGLADKMQRKLGSLSGGERQRVLFAQALIPKPSLLILDEPMTGLDLDGARSMENLVQEFRAAGATVLWVNHDIAQVYRVADHVTYINQQVLLDGPPREALHSEQAKTLFPTLGQLEAGSAA